MTTFVTYNTETKLIVRTSDSERGAKTSLTNSKKRFNKMVQRRIDEGSWSQSALKSYSYRNPEKFAIVTLDWYNANVRSTKKVKNLLSGKEIEIDINTPACCDPSTETYWSM